MNEGWASFMHKRILESIELPQELHLEFLVRHNQVCRPIPGSLNPYHLGLKLWEEIERIGNDPTPEERERIGPGKNGRDLLFETREVDRDVSFLRRWLSERVMRDLDIFRYEHKGDDLVVSDVADDDGWRAVKETLLRNVGMGGIPVIRVEDADFGGARTLPPRPRPRRPGSAARAGREDARLCASSMGSRDRARHDARGENGPT
jgi:stage V sporulation protein R